MTEASLQTSIVDEYDIHVAVFDYLCWTLPEAMIWHTPNGGKRDKATARKLKRMGVKPGVPDIAVLLYECRLFWFEVKEGKDTASKEQIEFMDASHHRGAPGAVVRSIDDVRRALKAWGIKTRESVGG